MSRFEHVKGSLRPAPSIIQRHLWLVAVDSLLSPTSGTTMHEDKPERLVETGERHCHRAQEPTTPC